MIVQEKSAFHMLSPFYSNVQMLFVLFHFFCNSSPGLWVTGILDTIFMKLFYAPITLQAV